MSPFSSNAPIAVIWNPSAGAEARNAEALELFANDSAFEVFRTESSSDMRRHVDEAIQRGVPRVVAAGGDGTVHAVADVILGSSGDVEFGVLPLGTGNDLARSLGMPLEPAEAREVLRTRKAVAIDVMDFRYEDRVRHAINMLTAGNTGKFMETLSDEMKQRWGPFCYLRGVIDVMQDLEVFPIELICDDGTPERYEIINLFLANGPTSGGGMPVSPDALLNDGAFDVVVVKDGPPAEIAQLTAQYVVSDFRQHELIETRRAKRVEIRSAARMPGTADGDTLEAFPQQVTIRPAALRAVVGSLEAAVAGAAY